MKTKLYKYINLWPNEPYLQIEIAYVFSHMCNLGRVFKVNRWASIVDGKRVRQKADKLSHKEMSKILVH